MKKVQSLLVIIAFTAGLTVAVSPAAGSPTCSQSFCGDVSCPPPPLSCKPCLCPRQSRWADCNNWQTVCGGPLPDDSDATAIELQVPIGPEASNSGEHSLTCSRSDEVFEYVDSQIDSEANSADSVRTEGAGEEPAAGDNRTTG